MRILIRDDSKLCYINFLLLTWDTLISNWEMQLMPSSDNSTRTTVAHLTQTRSTPSSTLPCQRWDPTNQSAKNKFNNSSTKSTPPKTEKLKRWNSSKSSESASQHDPSSNIYLFIFTTIIQSINTSFCNHWHLINSLLKVNVFFIFWSGKSGLEF